ncbi:helix-turn-helix transcriptional regulator [Cytobacillus sp. IB215316]|uniref:helix-turn-helix domain-containing protein n=1 Tax=Cytobacillus sp. IB215316 TaxID=3097354 RepID=UPI002A16BB43|nr:helix-turn-helix transcriptional regulator [Cytobacillus sp. IB215316]MDX8359800.1 helix-turn-helix transcriptional regulator [Cytobacillus sp. IB215316]
MKYEVIGERLRTARENKGFTLKEVGEILQLTFSGVSKFERGERKPSIEILEKFATTYNVTLDYLLGNSDDPTLTSEQEIKISAEAKELYEIIESLPIEKREEIIKEVTAYVKIKSAQENL